MHAIEQWLILAQASGTSIPSSLPDWIPPVLVVNLALAIVVILGNSRGFWVSGREHNASVKVKDDAITQLREAHATALAELKSSHTTALSEIKAAHAAALASSEKLRKEERDGRLSAEGRLGRVTEMMNRLSTQVAGVERMVTGAAASGDTEA